MTKNVTSPSGTESTCPSQVVRPSLPSGGVRLNKSFCKELEEASLIRINLKNCRPFCWESGGGRDMNNHSQSMAVSCVRLQTATFVTIPWEVKI